MPPPPLPSVTLGASQFLTTRGQSNASKADMSQWVSAAREVDASLVQNRPGGVGSHPVARSSRPISRQSSWAAKRANSSEQFEVYRRAVVQRNSGVEMQPPPPVETGPSQFTTTRRSSASSGAAHRQYKNVEMPRGAVRSSSLSGLMPPPPPPVETGRSQFATTRSSSVSSSAAHRQYKNVEIPRGAVSSSSLSSLMPSAPPQQQQQSSSHFASNRESAKRISGMSTDLPPQKRQKKVKSFVSEIKDPDTGKILKEEHEVYVSGETEAFARAWLGLARESLRKKSLRNNKKSQI